MKCCLKGRLYLKKKVWTFPYFFPYECLCNSQNGNIMFVYTLLMFTLKPSLFDLINIFEEMLFMREKKNITRKLLEAWYNLSLCSYTRQNTKFLKKVIILQQSFISSHFSFFNKQPLPLSLSERRGILWWVTRCCAGEGDDKKSPSSSSYLTSPTTYLVIGRDGVT